jgi:hypothetical protein
MAFYAAKNRNDSCSNKEECIPLIAKKGEQFLQVAIHDYCSLLERYSKLAEKQKEVSEQIMTYTVYLIKRLEEVTPNAFGRFLNDDDHRAIKEFSPLFKSMKQYIGSMQSNSYGLLGKMLRIEKFFDSRKKALERYTSNEVLENKTDSFTVQSTLAQNPFHFSLGLITSKDLQSDHPDVLLDTTVKNINKQLEIMKKILNLEIDISVYLKKLNREIDTLFNSDGNDIHYEINSLVHCFYYIIKLVETEIEMDAILINSNLIKETSFSMENMVNMIKSINTFIVSRRSEMDHERKIYLDKLSLTLYVSDMKNKCNNLLNRIQNVENEYYFNLKNMVGDMKHLGSEKMRNLLINFENNAESDWKEKIEEIKNKETRKLAEIIASFKEIHIVRDDDIL